MTETSLANSTGLFSTNERKTLWLIAATTLVRSLLASQLELGIDEVYYWNFVLYPDWSFFDHPLMIGVVGRIFSINRFLTDDFFLRLGPICISATSTWIVFLIGRKIKDSLTGFFSALLFSSSIYCSIIAGFSFIPDSPLVLFWLLALNATIDFLPKQSIDSAGRKKMIWFGVFAGLAMLSKYQGAFLWVGVFSYILIYNRRWLTDYSFYLSGAISAVLLIPILLWNYQNSFISFNYHSERVTPSLSFRADYFLTEVLGQVGYSNPFVYVLVAISVVALMRKKEFIKMEYARLLILQAVPLWLLFTCSSLFRSTLPHWSAPAFISLIVLAAAYWSNGENAAKGFRWMKTSLYFLTVLLAIALWLINYSPLQLGKKSEAVTFGEDDFTQDLFGWNQVNDAFRKVAEREEAAGTMPRDAGVVTYRMFPAAHLDFYVAEPNGRDLFAIGPLEDIHMYAWINRQRGNLQAGKNYYHIAVSNLYRDPSERFQKFFEKIELLDTVEIRRHGTIVRYAFFYKLKGYRGNFENPLPGR